MAPREPRTEWRSRRDHGQRADAERADRDGRDRSRRAGSSSRSTTDAASGAERRVASVWSGLTGGQPPLLRRRHLAVVREARQLERRPVHDGEGDRRVERREGVERADDEEPDRATVRLSGQRVADLGARALQERRAHDGRQRRRVGCIGGRGEAERHRGVGRRPEHGLGRRSLAPDRDGTGCLGGRVDRAARPSGRGPRPGGRPGQADGGPGRPSHGSTPEQGPLTTEKAGAGPISTASTAPAARRHGRPADRDVSGISTPRRRSREWPPHAVEPPSPSMSTTPP
jgi:hypothetical protein